MNRASSGGSAGAPRAPRDPAVENFAHPAPAPVRITPVVAGDFLLTVNPVDGSEIVLRPPGGAPDGQDWPPPPGRRTPAERAAHERASAPPVPAGPALPRPALVERDELRDRLTRLLGRGRSVRLTGPPGSGRTALLDLVAQDCGSFAPDGVIRLGGAGRTTGELLHALYTAAHRSERHRPGRAELLDRIAEVGAVVVLDDFEGSAAALTELLDAAPECAFLIAATGPREPGGETHGPRIDEAELEGLSRAGSLELLARLVDRDLTEDERTWAGDLWFESEGLPLRFVQAAALLRQGDALRVDPEAAEDASPFEGARTTGVPLPTLGQGAAPAALLASRLGASTRETLRLAVALGGEVPHQAHLPALIDDTHADSALGELTACGLLSPAGPRYRLAPGALEQLTEQGYGPGPDGGGTTTTPAATGEPADRGDRALTAARHYAWWTAHPSVSPERVAVESDAVLAALAALLPGKEPARLGVAVQLARAAAPVFAAGLHWSAWESTLRMGSEAARIAGEVAEEAYFHHELGVLALCTDNLGRARAELEASIGLRGALADKNGTVAGRRALALVTDREKRTAAADGGAPVPAPRAIGPGGPAAPQLVPVPVPVPPPLPVPAPRTLRRMDKDEIAVRLGPRPVEAGPVRMALPPGGAAAISEPLTVPESVATAPYPQKAPRRRRGLLLGGARRNLVAAGAGAVLVAVLGTVLSVAPASEKKDAPGNRVGTGESTPGEDVREDGPTAGETGPQDDPEIGEPTRQPTRTAEPGPSASASGDPEPEESRRPESPSPEDPEPTPSGSPKPSDSGDPSPSESPDPTPSTSPTETPSPTPTETESQSANPPVTTESAPDASASVSASGVPEREPETEPESGPESGSPSAG
ncbi:ATP-binding protein [Streptomyces sp. NPDC003691]